jgi:integrase
MSDLSFKVEFNKEAGYNRLYVSCSEFKGRIRKHVGKTPNCELNTIKYHLMYELEQHFQTNPISKAAVEFFIDQYVTMRIRGDGNIFDYFEQFYEFKKNTTNERTNKKLVKSTVTSYRTAKNHFEKFLIKEKIKPTLLKINKQVLDDFYHYLDAEHNHKVKMHDRLKAFIKYLQVELNLPVDNSFRKSIFNERYDNIDPNEDDIARNIEEVHMLIDLKAKFDHGIFDIEPYKRHDQLPQSLQENIFNIKKENLKLSLDCFLFMIATGMYYADVKKSKIGLYRSGDTTCIQYRRAKCQTLCTGIPVDNDDVFIGKQIIEEYGIRSGMLFPAKVSADKFRKHLIEISSILKLDQTLKNKQARKTFATFLYYNRKMPISILQKLTGHPNVKDLLHYLRLPSDLLANQAVNYMFPPKTKNIE